MLNFKKIFSIKCSHQKKFEAIIRKNKSKQFHFLLPLIPIMQQVLQWLNETIKNKYPNLADWLNEDFLMQLIADKFITVVNPMIIRACVLEMHLAKRNNLLEGDTPEARFDFFLENLTQAENIKDFFDKYSVLKEQLNIFATQFCNTMSELFQRLNHDKKPLIQHFLKGKKNYRITDIHASGDVHQQGRNVCILTFANSKHKIKIVYKPRSANLDIAFQKFVQWFNQHSADLSLKTIHILGRKDYAWCEFIDYVSCKNKKEIKQFYRRLGSLLMLIYLFRGGDIHGENLLAHGAHPMIVDFECLFTPLFSFFNKAIKTIPRFMVTQTLFLPAQLMADKDHKGLDISALGSEFGSEGIIPIIRWLDIGKDTMHAERFFSKMQRFLNKPKLKNKTVEYLDYEAEFLQGFHKSYLTILKHKSYLLSNRSPLNAFKKVKMRLVLRNTSYYFQFLYESWHPKYLVNRAERNRYFKTIARNVKKNQLTTAFIKAEIKDLQQNNIPYFSAFANATKLFDSTGTSIPSPILISGFSTVKDHLKNTLDQADLSLQKTLIKNSFSIARENRGLNPTPISHLNLKQKPLSEQQLKIRALALAKRELDQLSKDAFFIDGDIVWPSANVSDSGNWYMEFTSLDFYNGLPGIALVYLYASQIFPKHQLYAEITEHCLNTLKKWLTKIKLNKMNLMGAYSDGGIIYTLAAFYRVKPDKTLKQIMQNYLLALPKQINTDETFDIIGGAAGTLILLLSLSDIFSEATLMPLMTACVKRILKGYPIPSEFPLSGSEIKASKPLLGMAHGVAGIAWALAKYLRVANNNKAKQWITAALAYERGEFNHEKNNWPDYRELIIKKSTSVAWCHGAPGIGLARLDMLDSWQDQHIDEEIKLALNTTIKEGFGSYNCLCHGNFGNLELLYVGSQTYNDADLYEKYLRVATALITTLEQHAYQSSQLNLSATPGLMTGRSGIAYELLRMAHTDQVPCLLLVIHNLNQC